MSGNRKELRLREFSYSEKAAYFITICCRGGEHLLCEIEAETPGELRALRVSAGRAKSVLMSACRPLSPISSAPPTAAVGWRYGKEATTTT